VREFPYADFVRCAKLIERLNTDGAGWRDWQTQPDHFRESRSFEADLLAGKAFTGIQW
jgi:hypothetical protein